MFLNCWESWRNVSLVLRVKYGAWTNDCPSDAKSGDLLIKHLSNPQFPPVQSMLLVHVMHTYNSPELWIEHSPGIPVLWPWNLIEAIYLCHILCILQFIKGSYIYSNNTTPVLFSDDNPYTLGTCPLDDFCLMYTTPPIQIK